MLVVREVAIGLKEAVNNDRRSASLSMELD